MIAMNVNEYAVGVRPGGVPEIVAVPSPLSMNLNHGNT